MAAATISTTACDEEPMSRRKKPPHGKRPPAPPRPPTRAEKDEALIADTERIFSCFTEVTHDYLHQCKSDREHLACDIDYNRLAIQMWTGGPGRAAELVDILRDFLAARERYQAELAALRPRLADLLATPAHDHLHHPEQWRDAIRKVVVEPSDPTP